MSSSEEPDPEPEQEPQQEEPQVPEMVPQAELPAAKHTVVPDGIQIEHDSSQTVGWRSPRLMQAMLQGGVEEDELFEKDEERYLKDALRRGERLGWKSERAIRQIASRRHRRGELQRRKLLYMVVDMRQGAIDSNAPVSAVISPQKKISISDDKEMEAKLAAEAEARQRAMVSEEQRVVDANKRVDEQMQLKLEKEKEMIAVDQKIAARKRLQEEKAKKSQEAAMLWRIELDQVRKQEEQDEYERIAKFTKAREEKEKVLQKILTDRQAQSKAKALAFSKKQQEKVAKIQTEWKAKEKKLEELKDETEKKLLAVSTTACGRLLIPGLRFHTRRRCVAERAGP